MASSSIESNGEDKILKAEEEDGVNVAMQWTTSIVFPMTLHAAIELGVFNIIAKYGEGAKLSAKDIALEIGANNNPEAPKMLDRLLGLLASYSVLNCSVYQDSQRLYSLTPGSKYFVTDADGVSLCPFMTLNMDKVKLGSWIKLKEAILEGGTSFNRVYGMNLFEYMRVDPRFNEVFNKGMLNSTTITMKKILEVYQGFEPIKTLVDVGGGLGANLKLITSKYPRLQGVNFDLPHVIKHAPLYPGVEHVGGDMFESVPKGDAVFLKWMLHNWSDEECLKVLKNCYNAIPYDGKVIVVDTILPIVPETTAKFGFKCDVNMMNLRSGGKERTQQEFMELATRSGFRGINVVCEVSGVWVMEFFK